jgi:hypothetical protein
MTILHVYDIYMQNIIPHVLTDPAADSRATLQPGRILRGARNRQLADR